MKTIKVNPYDKKSIERATKELEAYKKMVNTKGREFLRRLAEEGCNVASMKFSLADYDGNNDVKVTISESGDTMKVVATGQAVCFIEFGSGVARGGGYPEDRKPEGIVGLGEYGKGHGATGQPWYYAHGKKTDGNPPAMAMLNARDAMVEKVTQIAREVFGA
jgi:hypothetical protein